jgi:hypothetical protein
LDSIRAVLNSGNFTSISPKPITTFFGYSGGAVASGWVSRSSLFRFDNPKLTGRQATELQPSYAPELDIAGAAIGGIFPNNSLLHGEL